MPIFEEIKEALFLVFEDPEIEVEDPRGDGKHLTLFIKAKEFNNQTQVASHRMVYRALKSLLQEKIHALQIYTEPLTEGVKK